MTTQHQQDAVPASVQEQEAQDVIALSRRRFIRTGTTGAVLTLASGSGMATVCSMPSGALNSRTAQETTCRGGMSPGYWKNHHSAWPNQELSSPTTLFGKVFACSEPMASLKLADAIAAESVARKAADPDNKCFHFTATYLNILTGYVTFMTVDQLKLMWNQLSVYSSYTPAAQADSWDREDVLDYLESTYHDTPPKLNDKKKK